MVHQSSQSGPLVYVPKKGPNAARYQTAKQAKEKKKKNKALQTFLDVVVILLVAGATYAMFKLTNVKPENQEVNNPSVVAQTPEKEEDRPEPEVTKEVIDLQPVLDSWATMFTRSVDVGVVIIDLDEDKVVGKLNPDEVFLTASLYKLFPVYEGYRRVENGEWSFSDASYGGYTVGECLDLAIRQSHSGCAENLVAKIGAANLNSIVQSYYGLENTNATELVSTAADIAEMMRIYYNHKDLSDESYAKILDSMLNQGSDPDGNDYRGGLPKGFTRGTKVYNKVGWDWNGAYWVVYDDASILEFPTANRHFAIAVMSTKFPSKDNITKLGDMLEEAILAYLEVE